VNVYEIMSKPVTSVEVDMDVGYCARLFEKFGLSGSPVMHDGRLVGVVSLTQIILQGINV